MSAEMCEGAVLVRREDGVEFRVTVLGHWSTIVSELGETDRVKWLGMAGERDYYVSASKGFLYWLG
jgi:hypothetical protein